MSFTHLPLSLPIAVALEAIPHKKFSDFGMPDDLSYAGIILESNGRHSLALGDKFHSLRDDQKAHVLLHEYVHLAFGHPLQIAQQKLNGERFNVAADAWINEVLPHHLTDELNGITYSNLRKRYKELPEYLIDPLQIYRLLPEEDFPQNGMDSIKVYRLEKDGTGQASIEILVARATLAEALKSNPELQAVMEDLRAGYQGSSHKYKDVKIADWMRGIYGQLDRLASQKCGDLVRRRGWRRPGRIPGTAGTSRRPSLNVMIALDVSGSTGEWWGDLIAACRGITRLHTVHIVCHSDSIVFEGSAIPVDAPVGGGTLFTPVVRAIERKRPDCVIWVTDGESGDRPKLPDCSPIFWVWLPNSRKWKLREIDYQVDYASLKG